MATAEAPRHLTTQGLVRAAAAPPRWSHPGRFQQCCARSAYHPCPCNAVPCPPPYPHPRRPHVLLLDEPTNHLDLLTVAALAAALADWDGAAVIASHDIAFLRDTCREVWAVEGGRAARLPQAEVGDALDSYTAALMEGVRRQRARAARKAA